MKVTELWHSLKNKEYESWQIALLVFIEILFCAVIIWKVSYTEIDYKAYMEEVEFYLNGERDYIHIYGNTGPLVYPAGFVYIFSLLYYLTDKGKNILLAQIIFAGIYVVNLVVVLLIYRKSKNIPFYLTILLVLSKRIHSIYCLRMFNDCVAMLLGHTAIYLFSSHNFLTACITYSLAVSVKMNLLLFAPGIFLTMVIELGFIGAVFHVFICGLVQLVVGIEFLTTYPINYVTKAFELGRVFIYKWTVNFKFLPEDVFLSKSFALSLLIATVAAYLIFMTKWMKEFNNYRSPIKGHQLSSRMIISLLFTSNFIGIFFARSLHYQFYCWYFFSIPYLIYDSGLDIMKKLPSILLLILAIEVAFNVYPSTKFSSLLLQSAHAVILIACYYSQTPREEGSKSTDRLKDNKEK